MLKCIASVLLLAAIIIATPAMACTSTCGPGGIFPPSRCNKLTTVNQANSTMTIALGFKTFGTTPSSTNSCALAVALPLGSDILSVKSVEFQDPKGYQFPGFSTPFPNKDTGAAFGRIISGLPVGWYGFQSPLRAPIPDGEPVDIVIEFTVSPHVSQPQLMKALSSAILATDGGNQNGEPVFHHLALGFGLGYPSLSQCVDDRVPDLCERDDKACVRKVRQECEGLFGLSR
jgi:hypothetical protein